MWKWDLLLVKLEAYFVADSQSAVLWRSAPGLVQSLRKAILHNTIFSQTIPLSIKRHFISVLKSHMHSISILVPRVCDLSLLFLLLLSSFFDFVAFFFFSYCNSLSCHVCEFTVKLAANFSGLKRRPECAACSIKRRLTALSLNEKKEIGFWGATE